jgi:hypothetical protein
MSTFPTAYAASLGRRLTEAGVFVVLGAIALAVLAVPAQAVVPAPRAQHAAATIETSISGFSAGAATISRGADWVVTAQVSGPGGRAVQLQRQSGNKWIKVSAVKTSPGGSVTIVVKKAKAGRYRLAVPASGQYTAAVSGVQKLITTTKKYVLYPAVVSGQYSGYLGTHHELVWSGFVTFDFVKYGGAGGFSYVIKDIIGTWHATDKVDADGTTYLGSGPINMSSVDMDFSRSFNYYDPTIGFRGHGGRYSFSQQQPYGQSIELTAVHPGGETSTITYANVNWINTSATSAQGRTLPVTSDPGLFKGSFDGDMQNGSAASSWSLEGQLLTPFYFVP